MKRYWLNGLVISFFSVTYITAEVTNYVELFTSIEEADGPEFKRQIRFLNYKEQNKEEREAAYAGLIKAVEQELDDMNQQFSLFNNKWDLLKIPMGIGVLGAAAAVITEVDNRKAQIVIGACSTLAASVLFYLGLTCSVQRKKIALLSRLKERLEKIVEDMREPNRSRFNEE